MDGEKYTMLTIKKKARVAVLILDRADCKLRKVIKDEERHYIMIERSILQEDVNNCNCVCA